MHLIVALSYKVVGITAYRVPSPCLLIAYTNVNVEGVWSAY